MELYVDAALPNSSDSELGLAKAAVVVSSNNTQLHVEPAAYTQNPSEDTTAETAVEGIY